VINHRAVLLVFKVCFQFGSKFSSSICVRKIIVDRHNDTCMIKAATTRVALIYFVISFIVWIILAGLVYLLLQVQLLLHLFFTEYSSPKFFLIFCNTFFRLRWDILYPVPQCFLSFSLSSGNFAQTNTVTGNLVIWICDDGLFEILLFLKGIYTYFLHVPSFTGI